MTPLSSVTLTPKQMVEFLVAMIPNQFPVLLKAPPGVGKSDIVGQATAQCGQELVLMHPVVHDPTNYTGMPAIVNGAAEFLPFGELRLLINAKKPTVCFFDDLGQAPACVQAAAMQLLLARRIGQNKVSDKVTFVAATNRKEDKAGVTSILEPVKSRFYSIVELGVHPEEWCQWALANGVPAEVVAFIRFRPELLMDKGTPSNDIVNRPCPRTVTFLGKMFSKGIRLYPAFVGAVGEGFAAEFMGFLRVWESLPDIESILRNPSGAKLPADPASCYAVVTALAPQVKERKNASAVMKYAVRLPEEFATLLIREAHRMFPAVANCREFITWAETHQADLV